MGAGSGQSEDLPLFTESGDINFETVRSYGSYITEKFSLD
jgi:hypothetical protein